MDHHVSPPHVDTVIFTIQGTTWHPRSLLHHRSRLARLVKLTTKNGGLLGVMIKMVVYWG